MIFFAEKRCDSPALTSAPARRYAEPAVEKFALEYKRSDPSNGQNKSISHRKVRMR
jgi:hypothetical protein